MENILELAQKYGLFVQEVLNINEMGIDFRVVFVKDREGETWVLRIPRRENLGTQIAEEKRILDTVRRYLTIQVPCWEIVSTDLVAYRLLDGEPALTFDAETYAVHWNMPADSLHYAPSLAKALVELHSIPAETAVNHQIKVLDPEASRQEIHDRLHTVKSGLGMSEELFVRYSSWLDNDKLWPTFTRFVHGDLYAGHVLTTPEGQVSGIIDWTTAQVNDIAIDFSGQVQVFGEEGLKSLIEEYRRQGGETPTFLFEQAVERAAAAPLAYGYFALTTGDEQHIQGAKAQLGVI
jgi:macrolide phosphotransferase